MTESVAVNAEPAIDLELERRPQAPTRLQMPDLLSKAWIFPRLMEIWPNKQRNFLQTWLGQITGLNEFHVIQTANAVAVFERFRDRHSDFPIVREWFVLAKDKTDRSHIEEAAELYSFASKWAFGLGAREMAVGNNSDVPKSMITDRLGRLESRPQSIAKVTFSA